MANIKVNLKFKVLTKEGTKQESVKVRSVLVEIPLAEGEQIVAWTFPEVVS